MTPHVIASACNSYVLGGGGEGRYAHLAQGKGRNAKKSGAGVSRVRGRNKSPRDGYGCGQIHLAQDTDISPPQLPALPSAFAPSRGAPIDNTCVLGFSLFVSMTISTTITDNINICESPHDCVTVARVADRR